jgi:transcriptional regulator with XRE-family HTH domain
MAIRRLRLANEMSQAELARKAGTERLYVSQIERSVRRPSLQMLQRLAKALGVEVASCWSEARHRRFVVTKRGWTRPGPQGYSRVRQPRLRRRTRETEAGCPWPRCSRDRIAWLKRA